MKFTVLKYEVCSTYSAQNLPALITYVSALIRIQQNTIKSSLLVYISHLFSKETVERI